MTQLNNLLEHAKPIYTAEYWEQHNREVATKIIKTEVPDFRTWLLERYGITPLSFKLTVLKTGRILEYRKAMAWYRMRYRKELEIREEYINNNPFKED